MSYIEIAAYNLPPSVHLGEAPTLAPTAIVRNSRFGRYTQVGEYSRLEDVLVDDYSYVCNHCELMSVQLGKFVNIASMVRINPGFHPMERPTLHHFTYRCEQYGLAPEDDADFFHWRRLQRVTIGHDVWIGQNAVIMPGLRIGNGAVIGSGSVVTKDVPAYAIVGGVAAKLIRYRFPRSIAEAVESTAWWDWAHETLAERMAEFRDLRSFLAKYAP
ncbi:MAG: acetyltransferase [Burkholderiaceae bacterium]|nr:hypothetical protein [Sulfuritalea sp.]MCF8173689.1 acetyltransferase [Burkholderiaceae bacterium]